VTSYGEGVLPWVAIGAGVALFIMLLLRVHEYATFVPSTVTQGVSLGVALLIMIYQFKNALGLRADSLL
jgi:MFS superfamily sulfate permease-like transporter